ncbi:uncharacterized protein [Argopecten irradians]|uniref:uncharacterized protein n=1 Tax=Argopecten irradians TaxID=31199 RepID=UPI003713D120
MISNTYLYLWSILLITWIGQSFGYERCVGQFYQTQFDSYYGRYSIGTNNRHIFFNYVNSYYSRKYCPDRCCTITEGYTWYYTYYGSSTYSYKTCCYSYVPVTPSYKPSDQTESRKGLVIGCAIGGTMFTVLAICSLVVARVMWVERKRIEPASTPDGSNPNKDSFVVMADNPESGPSSNTPSSTTTEKPATEVTIV